MGANGCGTNATVLSPDDAEPPTATRTPPMHALSAEAPRADVPAAAAAGAFAMGGSTGLGPHEADAPDGAGGPGGGSFAAMVEGISGLPRRPSRSSVAVSSLGPGKRKGGTGDPAPGPLLASALPLPGGGGGGLCDGGGSA